MGGGDKGGGGKGNGLTLEISDGITEHANRVALKGVFSAFGDVLACWVPPIDRRMVDSASVRFATAESAEAAKNACDMGQVFFQGLPLKVKWRQGGGPRVGNSDIGGAVGGNSPTRRLADDGGGGKGGGRGIRDRSRSRRRRDDERGAGRDRRRDGGRRDDDTRDRRRDRDDVGGSADAFNPMGDAQPSLMAPPDMMMQQMQMPPDMMMQMQQQSQPQAPQRMTAAEMEAAYMAQMPQALPEPVHIPTAEEIEAEARRRQEMKDKRAAQLKRGPGVAALVQGALKKAQTSIVKATAENEVFVDLDREVEKRRPKSPSPIRKTKAELDAERKLKEEEEHKERIRLEREAVEREKQKAKQLALEREREKEREIEEAANREARVKAGVEAAKKQQAVREGRVRGDPQAVQGPENLYGDMPEAGEEPEDDAAEKRRKEELRRAKKNFNLPPEDEGKVVFLDIDGVLRPARAGGFDILSEGKESVNPDTSDFFPSAMKALRHIMERTGAIVVLSSEWRRNEALREAIDDVLEANRIRPTFATTPVNVDEVKMSDPVRSFADRRAREVTAWLEEHQESIKGWVVLDDINLAIADEEKKASTKSMGPKLVQTWPLCGLTMGNAKTAVRILNGEMIHKVLVERPKAPGGINL